MVDVVAIPAVMAQQLPGAHDQGVQYVKVVIGSQSEGLEVG